MKNQFFQIKDVYTVDGDVIAVLLAANKKLAAQPDFVFEKKLVITDGEYERLVKETKKKTDSATSSFDQPDENSSPKSDSVDQI